ncbi:MAG: glycerol-3-phosphate 1-O-acyltransferase, partial [Arenimonas sp.]|nr:glycerol-3-phosphate 1-O-acyltransferase [Arenimonas sp.]
MRAAGTNTRSDAEPGGEPLPLPGFLPPSAASAAPAPRPAKVKLPLWARLLGRPLHPWLKLDIETDPQVGADARQICYVLEDYGLSNALILARAGREAGLPPPLQPIAGDPLGRKRAYVALSRRNASALAPSGPPSGKTRSESLSRLLQAHRADPTLDVQLVPVSIFVG